MVVMTRKRTEINRARQTQAKLAICRFCVCSGLDVVIAQSVTLVAAARPAVGVGLERSLLWRWGTLTQAPKGEQINRRKNETLYYT